MMSLVAGGGKTSWSVYVTLRRKAGGDGMSDLRMPSRSLETEDGVRKDLEPALLFPLCMPMSTTDSTSRLSITDAILSACVVW